MRALCLHLHKILNTPGDPGFCGLGMVDSACVMCDASMSDDEVNTIITAQKLFTGYNPVGSLLKH
jgi:hypothetical protein